MTDAESPKNALPDGLAATPEVVDAQFVEQGYSEDIVSSPEIRAQDYEGDNPVLKEHYNNSDADPEAADEILDEQIDGRTDG
ncbi:hypothetical protein [Mycetocola zhujimingii]|uniref:Uncharacterized protein n=1 Tax=Mycetocola zhujimingii TaxID=2079792 RepID=A0A2U1TD68_9MICO|nr:hypothetical protein [Mycetocola zhujimingii]AWB85287.1 hypothetical protein C3E77_00600 [Mycetocola zhujimingii]PWC06841.1 hypothetical protein DF223_09470 [Mycetocola zhujimingii]